MAGCTEEAVVSSESSSAGESLESSISKTLGNEGDAVTIPFKSHFMSSEQPKPPGYRESCGDLPFPPYSQAIQAGSGEATHLGRFTFRATFCLDITDVLDDGILTEGESFPYFNGYGVFTAANGDELWLNVEGAILPSDDPEYTGEFFDPFVIIGGTGRFEGASGGGMTKSYIKDNPNRVSHEWDGVLILPIDD
jgi:hypothetical protein